MWQEARKHEKHIRSVLVDYKKRAERRQDFYTKIKQDPIKFLRVYGTPAKIIFDAELIKAAENPNTLMKWTADPSVFIDRFDARANLEQYCDPPSKHIVKTTQEKIEERLCNYERYRCLTHNDFLGVTEAMALKQIKMDEKFGDPEERKRKEEEERGRKSHEPKAAIGFTYDIGDSFSGNAGGSKDSDSDYEADSDMDIDVELDLSVMTADQRRDLSNRSIEYGLKRSDFIRLLDADQQLETELRLAKTLEEEKTAIRKPRRRYLRDRRSLDKLGNNPVGPKIGLLIGQPITRRKIYLSGASSDSQSYDSPSSESETDGLRGRKRKRFQASQLARTKPSLFESKRPAIIIGGLTMVSFCKPKKNRLNYGNQHPQRQGPSSRGSGDGDSSSSSDSRSRSRGRNGGGGSKRAKVEYITTFGEEDEDEDARRRPQMSSFLSAGRPPPPAPTSAASKLAASVVSSLFRAVAPPPTLPAASAAQTTASQSVDKSPATDFKVEEFRTRRSGPSMAANAIRRRQSPTRFSYRENSPGRGESRRHEIDTRFRRRRPSRACSRSSSSSRSRGGRRNHQDRRNRSRSHSRRRHRPHSYSSTSSSSSSSRSTERCRRSEVKCSDKQAPFRNRSRSSQKEIKSSSPPPTQQAVPVRRYYRKDLESDEEKSRRISDEDEEKSDASPARINVSSTFAAHEHQRRTSTFTEEDGRRRYFGNIGEPGDFFAGKKALGDSRDNDRYSTSQQNSFSTPSASSLSKEKHVADGSASKCTPQELLKRRMQAKLNRTANADRRAEQERQAKVEKERQDRELGLRRLADQMRLREVERRKAERCLGGSRGSPGGSSPSRSSRATPSPSPSPPITPSLITAISSSFSSSRRGIDLLPLFSIRRSLCSRIWLYWNHLESHFFFFFFLSLQGQPRDGFRSELRSPNSRQFGDIINIDFPPSKFLMVVQSVDDYCRILSGISEINLSTVSAAVDPSQV